MPPQLQSALAADLSASATRERQLARESQARAELLRAKAGRMLRRAGRAPIRSNERAKLTQRAHGLLYQAAIADRPVA